MPLGADTATNVTAINMAVQSEQNAVSNSIFAPRENQNIDNENITTLPESGHEFEPSICLFCDNASSDLDCNLAHMTNAHGLHINPANLLVDIETLLAYFHFVIAGYNECLYCGTQRNTRQAVQQHMVAKGHCTYDVTNEDAEIREFHDFSELEAEKDRRRHDVALRFADTPSRVALKKSRRRKHPDSHELDLTASLHDQAPPTPTSSPDPDPDTNSHESEGLPNPPLQMSTRALKQQVMLDQQLSQLRTEDRRSLVHLPISQQRALLATHFKQMEKANRIEQTQRNNLERAGNKTNCLGKIRLIRKPPHTGNVSSLKR